MTKDKNNYSKNRDKDIAETIKQIEKILQALQGDKKEENQLLTTEEKKKLIEKVNQRIKKLELDGANSQEIELAKRRREAIKNNKIQLFKPEERNEARKKLTEQINQRIEKLEVEGGGNLEELESLKRIRQAIKSNRIQLIKPEDSSPTMGKIEQRTLDIIDQEIERNNEELGLRTKKEIQTPTEELAKEDTAERKEQIKEPELNVDKQQSTEKGEIKGEIKNTNTKKENRNDTKEVVNIVRIDDPQSYITKSYIKGLIENPEQMSASPLIYQLEDSNGREVFTNSRQNFEKFQGQPAVEAPRPSKIGNLEFSKGQILWMIFCSILSSLVYQAFSFLRGKDNKKKSKDE